MNNIDPKAPEPAELLARRLAILDRGATEEEKTDRATCITRWLKERDEAVRANEKRKLTPSFMASLDVIESGDEAWAKMKAERDDWERRYWDMSNGRNEERRRLEAEITELRNRLESLY